jgi:hypothetical protein
LPDGRIICSVIFNGVNSLLIPVVSGRAGGSRLHSDLRRIQKNEYKASVGQP